MHEQSIIEQFFTSRSCPRNDIALNIGDDATVVNVSPDKQLVMSMDTLNAGIHFPYSNPNEIFVKHFENETSPFDIGYKAAAVNLSDIAAMGAEPSWVMLSLSLPEIDHQWLQQFSDGFFALLDKHNVCLIGGDLNRGPLSVTVQAHGLVPKNQYLTRHGAKPDDIIYISGEVGAANFALHLMKQRQQDLDFDRHMLLQQVAPRLNRPTPRIELGQRLNGIASAALDVSDGLSIDLSRLLKASEYGAVVDLSLLPIDKHLHANTEPEARYHHAFCGGDDYELCFTVPREKQEIIAQISTDLNLPLTAIGHITTKPGMTLLNAPGDPANYKHNGHQHF